MITNLRKSKKKPWPARPPKFRRNLGGQVFFLIFLVFLAIGVIGFLVFTNWKINQRRAELQQRIEVLKREIQISKEKITSLRAGISQTESKDYQTERLYEQGYVEKGATQVVILPQEEKVVEEEEEKSPWGPQDLLEWIRSKLK